MGRSSSAWKSSSQGPVDHAGETEPPVGEVHPGHIEERGVDPVEGLVGGHQRGQPCHLEGGGGRGWCRRLTGGGQHHVLAARQHPPRVLDEQPAAGRRQGGKPQHRARAEQEGAPPAVRIGLGPGRHAQQRREHRQTHCRRGRGGDPNRERRGVGDTQPGQPSNHPEPDEGPDRPGEAAGGEDPDAGADQSRHHHDADQQRQLVVGAEDVDGELLDRLGDAVDHPSPHRVDQRRGALHQPRNQFAGCQSGERGDGPGDGGAPLPGPHRGGWHILGGGLDRGHVHLKGTEQPTLFLRSRAEFRFCSPRSPQRQRLPRNTSVPSGHPPESGAATASGSKPASASSRSHWARGKTPK